MDMSSKRTYFGFTTPQQRQRLFEVWHATGNVTEACRTARVSRGTFYHWKPRFDEQGYAGLEAYASRVAHHIRRTTPAIEQQVIDLRRQNPNWGKARLAHEMAQAHQWVPVVSPNTVKRILREADLWPESAGREKKAIPNRRSGPPSNRVKP